MSGFYGTSREDEERKLVEVNKVTKDKIEAARGMVASLQAELHEQKEVYDAEDKEGLAQWFNTDSRFQEVRKDLLRAERAGKKPYFGRIDFIDSDKQEEETYYIGKTMIARDPSKPIVIDWRTPVASVYYDHSLGKCNYKVPREGTYSLDLKRKRTYEIDGSTIKNFYDSDVVANDDLLTEYLSKSKRNVLSEIIATIQQEQNEIIRMNPRHNIVVQGSAGSGKTTVAMHRISYILYNYELEFKPESFYIIGSNKVLLNYITGVLPDLDVYGVRQMTMEELFAILLYEEWDKHKKIRPVDKLDKTVAVKGTGEWFMDLKRFCDTFEQDFIPKKNVTIPDTNTVIITKDEIEEVIRKFRSWSLKDKLEKLDDILNSHLETELAGKYLSYNIETKKHFERIFKDYFKKFQWTGSVFGFYEDFLSNQEKRGKRTSYVNNEPDMYDLASLAYIYKRFKETEVIQEASHVVIDEAQDFGMAIYHSLKYCMSKCTFTIMGDVSQNISLYSGIGDWEALKTLMLPDKFDRFGLLRKSYRNTVEISKFATDILKHGTFPIYPVEPIVRHGDEVKLVEASDDGKILCKLADILNDYRRKEYETIAVITKDKKECDKVTKALSQTLPVKAFSNEEDSFGEGIMVLPIEYSKGLEFDAVVIYNPTSDNYPYEDGYVKLLYVAATRALHELSVVYCGELTKLISTPVPEGADNNVITEDTYHLKPYVFEEDTRTHAEVARDIAKEGDLEMERRKIYGPKRIEVTKPSEETNKLRPVTKDKQTNISFYNTPELETKTSTGKVNKQTPKSEFGTMPETGSLQPEGHMRVDNSVKWFKADKTGVEITTGTGIIKVLPVSDSSARIVVSKTGSVNIKALPEETPKQAGLKWKVNENREVINIEFMKLKVSIAKRTGVISYINKNNVTVLTENETLPRQQSRNGTKWWQYFNFSKKEILTARGREDFDWPDIVGKAKYISHCADKDRPAILMSTKGYQLVIPDGIHVLACTIPAYGQYLLYDDSEVIDYIIRVV